MWLAPSYMFIDQFQATGRIHRKNTKIKSHDPFGIFMRFSIRNQFAPIVCYQICCSTRHDYGEPIKRHISGEIESIDEKFFSKKSDEEDDE